MDTCAICGRRTVPGITESGTPACYRLGYAREKARADAAEARAEKALAQRLVFDEALVREKEALAAARRECEELRGAAKEAESLILWLAMKEARDKYGSPWRRCVVCDRPSKHGDTDKQSHESNCAILLHLQKPSIRTALAAPGDGEVAPSPEAPPAKCGMCGTERPDATDAGCPSCWPMPDPPVAPAPSDEPHPLSLRTEFEKYKKAEKRIAEMERLLRLAARYVALRGVDDRRAGELFDRIDAAISDGEKS